MSPEEASELGQLARLDMLAQLQARGVPPEWCPRLLDALHRGVEQAAVAFNAGRDVRDYRRYVNEVYERLEAREIVDEPPRPPKRHLNPLLLDSSWRPGPPEGKGESLGAA